MSHTAAVDRTTPAAAVRAMPSRSPIHTGSARTRKTTGSPAGTTKTPTNATAEIAAVRTTSGRRWRRTTSAGEFGGMRPRATTRTANVVPALRSPNSSSANHGSCSVTSPTTRAEAGALTSVAVTATTRDRKTSSGARMRAPSGHSRRMTSAPTAAWPRLTGA